MSRTLYHYYERELTFIRQLAQEFALQYPAAAGRLRLEPNRSTDPHVERLIEAFALLAGRIQLKLDDEFPELTGALLEILYPHYLAPIPSMAIVQFVLDPSRAELPQGFRIDRGSRLRTQRIGDVACRFRTGYPVTLWPLRVSEARFSRPPFPGGLRPPRGTAAALRLRLECLGKLRFADLELNDLRFYLKGESETVSALYEVILNRAIGVVLIPEGSTGDRPPPIPLSPGRAFRQVGFAVDEGLIPAPPHAFPGYRLLSEFFAFPEKFHFLDLAGLDQARHAGCGGRLDVIVFVDQSLEKLEQDVDSTTFQLGCTPVINLFEKTAEPIPLNLARSEYRIVPDVASPEGLEIHSVDQVTEVDPVSGTTREYQPFYSFRHGTAVNEVQTFWFASRRPSLRPTDRGTEVDLHLVDLGFDPRTPAESTLVVRTTCTNRELPLILQKAGERLRFDLEAAAPISEVRCLRSPSTPLRPPLRRGLHWRLVSHLSLNHLSISHGSEGRDALRELLRLYDYSDPSPDKLSAMVIGNLIEGIASVTSRNVVGRPPGSGGSFCRGTEITITFDEEKYVGTGIFLFASVLERFLALYASINSFTQVVVRTTRSATPLKIWPPRAGELPLI